MIEERLKYARTGHRDCCDDMIRRRDTVITRDGEGRVIWACGKWWVTYPGRRAEALNKYSAEEIRRVAENATIGSLLGCDNTCDNTRDNACDKIFRNCDNNPLSHILSHPLSQPKLVEIQRITAKV